MPPTLETVTTDTYVRGSAPLPHLPCLHRIACPENGDIWRGKPGKEVRFVLSLSFSGECSHGAHGLLRFRTDDVLLGTSGVCLSVCWGGYRFPELRPPFNRSVSYSKPSRWREVPTKPDPFSIFCSQLSGLNFAHIEISALRCTPTPS